MLKFLLQSICAAVLISATLALPHSDLAKHATTTDKSQCNNNVVLYWGQDSAANGGLTVQGPLRQYCDSNADVLVLAFLYEFSDSTGYPVINFANQCDPSNVLNGTNTLHCPQIGLDIAYCQSQGKVVLLSLGGWTATTTAASANDFADKIWNMFLGGTSSVGRPFDSAVLDGVDWDIEHAPDVDIIAVSQRLHSYYQSASKKYYMSAAPFCSGLSTESWNAQLLTEIYMDWIWPQFYNDWCSNNYYPNPPMQGTFYMNFGDWAAWASNGSNPNPNVKIAVGVISGTSAGNPSNFVSSSVLGSELAALQSQYPKVFGGVMMWDASYAYDESPNYAGAAKQAMANGASCSSSPPVTSSTTGTSTKSGMTSTSTSTSITSTTSTTITSTSTTSSSTSTPSTGACTSANNGQSLCTNSGQAIGYNQCVSGSWVSRSCGAGTVCIQSDANDIECGFATRKRDMAYAKKVGPKRPISLKDLKKAHLPPYNEDRPNKVNV